MEHQEILSLLHEANDSKFVTKKWTLSTINHMENMVEEVKLSIIQTFWSFWLQRCHISGRGDIAVTAAPASQIEFKNCAPFIKFITKIDQTTTGDVEDLDLVMLIYNLIEYSSNYSETTGSLWFYSKDEATNFNADIANNYFKPFEYKA